MAQFKSGHPVHTANIFVKTPSIPKTMDIWLILLIPHQGGIHHRQIFSGGVSDQNENLVGKFLHPSGAQKKRFPNFLPEAAFFVMETLKSAKKTVKNR